MNNKVLGYSAIAASATLMGFVGLFSRNIETSGSMIAFTRMTVGMLCVLMILLYQRKFRQIIATKLSPTIIISGICLGGCLAAYVTSTKYTTLANAVLLIYTGPIFSTILAAIFLKESLTLTNIILLLLVFVGCLFVIGIICYIPESGFIASFSFDEKYLIGNLLGLISGFGYGLYLFFSRYRTDVASDVRSFFNFLFGAIIIAVYFLIDPPSFEKMNPTSWVWLLSMGFFIGFCALSLLTFAAKHLQSAELACVAYLEPVVAAGIGIFVFSESMSTVQDLGGIMIICGGVGKVLCDVTTKRAISKVNLTLEKSPVI